MRQPKKIFSASCLALSLFFATGNNAQAINVDDSLSIEAGLQRCNAKTELARLTIEGCYQGLNFVSSDFPFKQKDFADLPACLSTMENLDLQALLDRQFARCDREWSHIYFRRGCKDAATAYYSSLDPMTFCTRGGVGVVPVMPLPKSSLQHTGGAEQFILSEPLSPRMTPILHHSSNNAISRSSARNYSVEQNDYIQECQPEKSGQNSAQAKKINQANIAPLKSGAKQDTKKTASSAPVAKAPTVTASSLSTISGVPKSMHMLPGGSNALGTSGMSSKIASEASAVKLPLSPEQGSNLASGTNVVLPPKMDMSKSIGVSFNPAVQAAQAEEKALANATPEAPAVQLVPSGHYTPQTAQTTPPPQVTPVPTAESTQLSSLPPSNQYLYQSPNNAAAPASLRDIPLGVPNQPIEGLSGENAPGSHESPSVYVAPAPTPPNAPSHADNNGSIGGNIGGSIGGSIGGASNAPVTPVAPVAPVSAAPNTLGAPNMFSQSAANIPDSQFSGPTQSMPAPPAQAPSGSAEQSPGPITLPGFFSNPNQTQSLSLQNQNEPTLATSSEAANDNQPTSTSRESSQSIGSGAPTPPPSLAATPFATDPR